MSTDNQIIEKIRKLLALAERGGTEAEADAAMGKVQELLIKHSLDIDAVRKPEEVTMKREYKEYAWNQSWIREAYAGIAKLYFCKFYYEQYGTDKQLCYLMGEPVNIQTAQYVADVVIQTGNKLAKEYASQKRQEFLEWCTEEERSEATGTAISASNGFKKGYALRINNRCNELIRTATEVKPNASKGNQLVVADFYKKNSLALVKFQESIGLKLGNGAGMRSGDHGHMGAGAKAADSVNLRSAGLGKASGGLLLTKS